MQNVEISRRCSEKFWFSASGPRLVHGWPEARCPYSKRCCYRSLPRPKCLSFGAQLPHVWRWGHGRHSKARRRHHCITFHRWKLCRFLLAGCDSSRHWEFFWIQKLHPFCCGIVTPVFCEELQHVPHHSLKNGSGPQLRSRILSMSLYVLILYPGTTNQINDVKNDHTKNSYIILKQFSQIKFNINYVCLSRFNI